MAKVLGVPIMAPAVEFIVKHAKPGIVATLEAHQVDIPSLIQELCVGGMWGGGGGGGEDAFEKGTRAWRRTLTYNIKRPTNTTHSKHHTQQTTHTANTTHSKHHTQQTPHPKKPTHLKCIQAIGSAIRACHQQLGIAVGKFALHHAYEIWVFRLLNDLFVFLWVVHTTAVIQGDVDCTFDSTHLIQFQLWAYIQVDIPILTVQHLWGWCVCAGFVLLVCCKQSVVQHGGIAALLSFGIGYNNISRALPLPPYPRLLHAGNHLFWKLRLDLGNKVRVWPFPDHGVNACGTSHAALLACRCTQAAVHAAWCEWCHRPSLTNEHHHCVTEQLCRGVCAPQKISKVVHVLGSKQHGACKQHGAKTNAVPAMQQLASKTTTSHNTFQHKLYALAAPCTGVAVV